MAKTLTQQHAELVELHGIKVGELAAAVAECATLKASLSDFESRFAAAAETIKKQGDEIAQFSTELAGMTAERDALKTEVEKSKEEAAKLKAELELRPVPATDGAAPVSDGLEASGKSLAEQYRAITDPAEKTAFYRKHKAALWAGK